MWGGEAIDHSIYRLIQNSAHTKPNSPAILAAGRGPLTYGRLLVRVDDMHQILRRCGIRRRDRVAILVSDGPELAVALLAVASSAVCIPVGAYHRGRELASLLAAVDASALVVDSRIALTARDARCDGFPIIELLPERDGEAGAFRLTGERINEPAADEFSHGEDTALVLLTSGTTARPKRVPLTHTNLCASARHLADALALSPRDRGVDMMPLYHSGGVQVLNATLTVGGAVMCPPCFDAETFFSLFLEFRPTWYAAVAAMHHAIVADAEAHRDALRHSDLRFICTAAAPASESLVRGLERVFKVPVIQTYGSTEAGAICSNPPPPGRRKAGSVGVSVGPDIRIANEHGSELPAGVAGEVLVRGPNVFPGYEDDPATLAVLSEDGWLRTGDVGWRDQDGYVFLKGRTNDLINRGGEKVWPSEVEDVLQTHPAVTEVAVFGVAHPTLGEDVAGAVVPSGTARVTEQQLREFAAQRLPRSRVPSRVLIVDRIPKTPTGKVNRAELAKCLVQQLLTAPFVAPRDPLERALAGIWAESLGIDRVGVHDNFLQLGGNSLAAAEICSRYQTLTGRELSVATLLQAPTLAQLAETLRGEHNGDPPATPGPAAAGDGVNGPATPGSGTIPRRGRPGPCRLSFSQQRLWFLEQLAPGNIAYNVPMAVQLRGGLQPTALSGALNAIVDRHEALRTTFVIQGEEPLQVVADHRVVELPVVDVSACRLEDRAGELARVLRAEARRPFDLSRDMMLRALLVRLAADDHVLLVTLHHIASDGWSLEVLTRELSELYSAHVEGRPATLSPLPIQYGDYATWQRHWLQGPELRTQLAYWTEHLAGMPPTLQLPTDRPRPAILNHEGAQATMVLPRDLADALKALSRRERVTLFMTLLTAFQTLVQRYAGIEDVVVGTAVAGRRRVETEALIGFFVNTLPLRTDLSGDPTFHEALARVRDVVLGAFDHQDLPFDKLVEELRPERSLSWMPLVQVMFT
ncbi:MAG TPA: condensation domain-containing protein, partial [bacterium]|nr:condensation domain-containing protein [bacterium]